VKVTESLNRVQKLAAIDYGSKLGNLKADAGLTPAMLADLKEGKDTLKQMRKMNRWQSYLEFQAGIHSETNPHH